MPRAITSPLAMLSLMATVTGAGFDNPYPKRIVSLKSGSGMEIPLLS